MHAHDTDPDGVEPSADSPVDVERLEQALASYRRGSVESITQLLGDDDPRSHELYEALGAVVELHAQSDASPPPKIGPFTIVRTLGRGGMGVVYEATQPGTERSVALKLIRHYHAGDSSEANVFRREVRTLSRLQHPHIAALYEAGQTPSGDYYVAMELIRGQSLYQLIVSNAENISLLERVRIFLKVCRGINYAHQRGVIHCDLKPSNICIDEKNEPKVLDFGLARLMESEPGASLLSRETSKIVGTLAYLSPEQAKGDVGAIDIRSDVFGLGAVFYELLSGRRPYGDKHVNIAQAIHNACHTIPLPPSRHNPRVPAELDAIVLKCLEKDPLRRYQSAAELADDLDRYLAGRPVMARPASRGYRLRKWIGRNKFVSCLLAVVLILLASAAGIYITQSARVADERDNALANANRARRTSDYLTRMLSGIHPDEVGTVIPVRLLLDRAALSVDQELSDDDATRAAVHDSIGRSYSAMQEPEKARHHLETALFLMEKLYGPRSPEYAATVHNLALSHPPKSGERTRLLQQSYELRGSLFGEDSLEAAESLLAIADDDQWHQADLAAVEKKFRKVCDIRERELGFHRETARALYGLGLLLVREGRFAEAAPNLERAREIQLATIGANHFELALTLQQLAEVYSQRSDWARAERVLQESLHTLEALYPDGHKRIAEVQTDLASLMESTGRLQEADGLHQKAVAMEKRQSRDGSHGLTANNYCVYLLLIGRPREALPYARHVEKDWHAAEPGDTPAKAYANQNLGMILLELRELDEAEAKLRLADRIWLTLFGAGHHKRAVAQLGLGRLALIRGDRTHSLEYFASALKIRQSTLGPDHPDTLMAELEFLKHSVTNLAEARDRCKAITDKIQATLGENHQFVALGLMAIAVLDASLKESDEAAAYFDRAAEAFNRLGLQNHPARAECLLEQAKLTAASGNQSQATQLRAAAKTILSTCFGESDPRTIAVPTH